MDEPDLPRRVPSTTFPGDGQGHMRSRTVTHLVFEDGLLYPGTQAVTHSPVDWGSDPLPFPADLLLSSGQMPVSVALMVWFP